MVRRSKIGKSSSRSSSDVVAWIAVGLLFAAPIGAIVGGAVVLADSTRESSSSPTAVSIHVEEAEFLDSVAIDATLVWTRGPSLKAPEWSGLVTEVSVTEGSTLRDGDRLAMVDRVWRLVATTKRPFSAPVTATSPPEEIAALASVLARHGADVPTKRWTSSTLAAVRALAAEIGVPDAARVEAFDPSWVVWMPWKEIEVGSVGVVAGALAPGIGEDVVVGVPTIDALNVVAASGELLPDVGDEWVIRLAGLVMPSTVIADAEALAGIAVPAELALAAPEALQGVMERSEPVSGWRVPVTAVHTDASGVLCVFRISGREPVSYESVVVAAHRGSIGTARVTGALRPRDRVLVNPSDIVRERSCG